MIKCASCTFENPEGSISCMICGLVLDKNTTLSTRSIAVATPSVQADRHHAHLDKMPEKGVAIYVGESKEPLILAARDRLTLGRRKDMPAPDLVDLTAYDAYRKGVSRNHAVLTYKDNRLYIHDVGSVNGTWLNGQRLKSYELYALQTGTSVSLGQLVIYIYY
jgi:FHA domain